MQSKKWSTQDIRTWLNLNGSLTNLSRRQTRDNSADVCALEVMETCQRWSGRKIWLMIRANRQVENGCTDMHKDTSQYCVKWLDQHQTIFDKVFRNLLPKMRTFLYIRWSEKLDDYGNTCLVLLPWQWIWRQRMGDRSGYWHKLLRGMNEFAKFAFVSW